MDKKKQDKIFKHELKRKARRSIKRHQTFVESKGTLEARQAKNMEKYPSLAGPDKRPSLSGIKKDDPLAWVDDEKDHAHTVTGDIKPSDPITNA